MWSKRLSALLLALLIAAPRAVAQDSPSPASVSPDEAVILPHPDWDLVRDPRRRLTLASVTFDSGIGIAARCQRGNFELVLAGLPRAPGDDYVRILSVAFRDGEFRDTSWTVSEDRSAAFNHLPARFARQLRQGGRLQVRVPGEGGGPATRYVLDLPPSADAIEEALKACDRPLEHPHDALLPDRVGEGVGSVGLKWVQHPRGDYPFGANLRWASVVLTCVVQADGRLDQCIVESEHPSGHGFGDEAIRASRRGRVGPMPDSPPGAMIAGRRITFTTTYRLVS